MKFWFRKTSWATLRFHLKPPTSRFMQRFLKSEWITSRPIQRCPAHGMEHILALTPIVIIHAHAKVGATKIPTVLAVFHGHRPPIFRHEFHEHPAIRPIVGPVSKHRHARPVPHVLVRMVRLATRAYPDFLRPFLFRIATKQASDVYVNATNHFRIWSFANNQSDRQPWQNQWFDLSPNCQAPLLGIHFVTY